MRKIATKSKPKVSDKLGKEPNRQAENLMKVGIDLFSRKDYASVSIKDIARAANVNSALIYYYFTNKEDLFRASIEHAIMQALDNYARLKERHSDPTGLIDDWFENNVEMSSLMRKLVKIMIDYAHSASAIPSVQALIERFYAEETSILSNGIRQGIAQGVFEPVDPDRVAQFASVHLDGIMVASMVRPDFDLPAAIGRLRQAIWGQCARSIEAAA
jgi:AcrR family transcriptional regulator